MIDLYSEAALRATEYATRNGLSIVKQLGSGTQGIVFSTNCDTAIKALLHTDHYLRERDVYLRLRDRKVDKIRQFWVPQLTQADDNLRVIEMEVVRPPFVLDFASAYLDQDPPYLNEPEVIATWEREKREQFEGRWPEVKKMMREFRALGIHLADVKPGNVVFVEDDD
ncbi:MAG TPA: hypothetical protein VFG04_01845 [Planctomycetaceae bacterium]|jgi:hypothetical protein|nr:hypothetical protein [Planctomycetaceae bacterium]